MKNVLNQGGELTRRNFMQHMARSFLGVSLLPGISRYAFGAEVPHLSRTAKNVIYLYMGGGMSHLDTLDCKPGTEVQGPVESIPTNVPGIHISEYLPLLAKHMDSLALVNSLHSTQGAHEQGDYFMHSSYVKRGTIQHPGMGAWLLKLHGLTNSTLPGNIRIGGNNNMVAGGFLERKYAPLVIGNPEDGLKNSKRQRLFKEDEFKKNLKLAQAFDEEFHGRYDMKEVRAYGNMCQDALKLMESEDLLAFNIKNEPDAMRERYGRNSFGQGCLLARKLVEHDVRFVEVYMGGWDSHQNNFDQVEANAAVLDQGMSALLADLKQRGLLEDTLVVLATEFGRTPDINENDGRDHYAKAFSCALAGGGIQGGQVYGKTDETGSVVVEDRVEIPDFNATIAYALGLPLDKVIASPSKRPFTVAHKGQPLTKLFG